MRFKYLIPGIVLLSSCFKKEGFDQVAIFGHAGNGIHISNSVYHDNTQEAVDLALAQNDCEGVELDIQLSADGTAWLFHDPILDIETKETGCVPEKTDVELSGMTYCTAKKERLLPLSELNIHSKAVFLDLKHGNECSKKVLDVQLLLDDLSHFRQKFPTNQIFLITQNEDWITPILDEQFELFYECSSYAEALQISGKYSLKGFIFKSVNISKDEISDLKAKGFKTVLFEVRSPKGIRRALRQLPDYILTDDIKATLIEKY